MRGAHIAIALSFKEARPFSILPRYARYMGICGATSGSGRWLRQAVFMGRIAERCGRARKSLPKVSEALPR
jgi:hypothetical protein